ncbi:unnamed protein product [Darwinula stevensoni]|uniref:Uncharacterized protein n=1 Tax=Darwinula stevensoni TaxID=69355 RepID=A0A7R8WZU4_9CRUS|nr:unnamed protein product [Darwinula stevensoni]CAG0880948.1 unnamed protein product [Darwinula stevensoni]
MYAYERLKLVIQLEEGDKQFPSHLLKKVITSYAPMPVRGTKTRANYPKLEYDKQGRISSRPVRKRSSEEPSVSSTDMTNASISLQHQGEMVSTILMDPSDMCISLAIFLMGLGFH